MEALFLEAEPGETFEDIWGESSGALSCDPEAVFVFAYLVKSEHVDPFKMTVVTRYAFDEALPRNVCLFECTGYRKKVCYKRTRASVENGWSRPIYWRLQNNLGVNASGTISVLYRGEVLFERQVAFDCAGGELAANHKHPIAN